MKSNASIVNHPIHPVHVTIPVGAFVLVLLADIGSIITHDPFWYRFSFDCLVIGILSALPAASFWIDRLFHSQDERCGQYIRDDPRDS